MDGTGYPDHLSGEEIPLVARVMTIVDIYDALTTTRSYRKRLPPDVALDIMWEEAKKGWWDKDAFWRNSKDMLKTQLIKLRKFRSVAT